MSERQIIWYCGLLMTLSAFSIDILLPAFSDISMHLDEPYQQVQMTIPVFIVAFGVGQFFAGSLSDRYGRRPVLIAGQVLFILGSLIGAAATNIETLLLGRVLQGLGGCVGHVVGRALMRDLFQGKELGRAMAMASAVFSFGPIVAPLVGAGLMIVAGWRVLFVLMLVFALALTLVAVFGLKETNRRINEQALWPSIWMLNLKTIFSHPESRYFLCLSGIIMSLMMSILTAIPRVYETEFGVSGMLFAVYFAAHGIGIPIGQAVNRHLISSVGILKATICGAMVLALASLLIFLTAGSGFATVLLVSLLLIMFATSYLIVYSNSAALTLEPHPDIAGFTSSMYGSISQIVSATIGVIVAFLVGGSLLGLSGFLVGTTLFILFALVLWNRRWQ